LIFLVGCSKSIPETKESPVVQDIEVNNAEDISENIKDAQEIVEITEKPKVDFSKLKDQEECEANEGDWILSPRYEEDLHYSCHEKLDDAGVSCVDNSDCKGDCLPHGNIGGYTAYGKCSEYDVHNSCQTVINGAIITKAGCA